MGEPTADPTRTGKQKIKIAYISFKDSETQEFRGYSHIEESESGQFLRFVWPEGFEEGSTWAQDWLRQDSIKTIEESLRTSDA